MASLEGLAKTIENLQISMDIIDGYNPEIGEECDRLIRRVEYINLKIDRANKLREEFSQLLEYSKNIGKRFDIVKAQLLYIQNHFPRGLIKISNTEEEEEQQQQIESHKDEVVKSDMKISTPRNTKVGTSGSSMTNGLGMSPAPNMSILHVPSIHFPSSGSSVASSTGRTSPNPDLDVAISYVTDEEFNQVSSYMKGRLTVTNVNEFIDVFNSTLSKKYKVLNKSKKLKTKQELDQSLIWKEQEKGDLKGTYFCTADDFDKLSAVKIGNKKYLSIITVLRHLKRMKEVRSFKTIHYVACF